MKLQVNFEEQCVLNACFQQTNDIFDTGFDAVQTVSENDYNNLQHLPQINSITLKGNLSSEDLGITALPSGGLDGDILMKKAGVAYTAQWVTPASNAEKDNTRPITSAAVYTEIGNINALLATI